MGYRETPGFRCQCGETMVVINTRNSKLGAKNAVRRRRKCNWCGRRCTTYETAHGPWTEKEKNQ